MPKCRDWASTVTASISAGGPIIQPIRNPVMAWDFETLLMTTILSPGRRRLRGEA